MASWSLVDVKDKPKIIYNKKKYITKEVVFVPYQPKMSFALNRKVVITLSMSMEVL